MKEGDSGEREERKTGHIEKKQQNDRYKSYVISNTLNVNGLSIPIKGQDWQSGLF